MMRKLRECRLNGVVAYLTGVPTNWREEGRGQLPLQYFIKTSMLTLPFNLSIKHSNKNRIKKAFLCNITRSSPLFKSKYVIIYQILLIILLLFTFSTVIYACFAIITEICTSSKSFICRSDHL